MLLIGAKRNMKCQPDTNTIKALSLALFGLSNESNSSNLRNHLHLLPQLVWSSKKETDLLMRTREFITTCLCNLCRSMCSFSKKKRIQGTDGEVVTPAPSFAYGKFLRLQLVTLTTSASKHRENEALFLHRLYRSLLETSPSHLSKICAFNPAKRYFTWSLTAVSQCPELLRVWL